MRADGADADANERAPTPTRNKLNALSRPKKSQHSATASTEKAAHPDWDTLGFGLRDVGPVSLSSFLSGGEKKRQDANPKKKNAKQKKHRPPPKKKTTTKKTRKQSMYVATWTEETGWQEGGLRPYGPLELLPSAQALNYGQAIFEGMKALRPEGDGTGGAGGGNNNGNGGNGGNGAQSPSSSSAQQQQQQPPTQGEDRIVLFRPDRNAARMAAGAERMAMPPVPADLFLRAVERAVRANASFVPPPGKGSFYLRPLLLGTGPILGLGPAPSFTFAVFGAAVGAYFKGGQLTPIHLLVEEHFHRSAPRGMGGTKAAGNYSPVLPSQLAAKKAGYSDVVYLDARHDRYLEEVSSCNVFCVRGRRISTPPLAGSILPGVTRASVVELARARGYEVVEEAVDVEDAMKADELFTTGTAVVVCSVGSLTYKGRKRRFVDEAGEGGQEKPGPVALEIYEALTGLQTGRRPDDFGWVHPVPL